MQKDRSLFILTLPVMLGYIPLGMTFGILFNELGIHPFYAILASVIIFAGAGQFLLVALLSAKAGVIEVAISSFLLNLRHFFYTISLMESLKKFGWKKHYIIFGLTDETFAMLKTSSKEDENLFFKIALLNHLYWIIGTVLGLYGGKMIDIDYSGIEFSLTALFVVLSLNLYIHQKQKEPFVIGLAIGVAALVFFPPSQMLVMALTLCVVVMVAQMQLKRKHE